MDIFTKIIVDDMPLSTLFQSQQNATSNTTTEPAPNHSPLTVPVETSGKEPMLLVLGERINSSFEDLRGDAEIHAPDQWSFYYPQAYAVPGHVQQQAGGGDGSSVESHDVFKLVRGVLGQEALRKAIGNVHHQLFDELSRLMNELKWRINTHEARDERDFARYLCLLGSLNSVTENSTRIYCYVVPRDDDGVHGRGLLSTAPPQHKQQTLLYSDDLLFERLHILLSLLAFHQDRLRELSLSQQTPVKQRTELVQKCIDVLHEIECVATQSSSSSSLLTYRRVPLSLSSSASSSTTQGTSLVRNVTVQQFVERCLGGVAGIRARRHVCQARRCELIMEDQRARGVLDKEYDLLGAIVDNYARANAQALASGNDVSKLACGTRFLHHFWLCKANFRLAQELVTGGGDDAEALQRVAFVSRQHTQFCKNPGPFKPDKSLREQFNKTILESNEFYKKLHLQLKDRVFIDKEKQYQAASFPPYDYGEKESTLTMALDAARRDLAQDKTLHLSTLAAIFSQGAGIDDEKSQDTSSPPFRLPSALRIMVRGDVDVAAEIGVLMERCNAFRWLLAGAEEGKFTFTPEDREEFAAVLNEAEKKLAAMHQ